MKLLWLTDIHLNFLEKEDRMYFYKEIESKLANKIIITGDIAEAPSVCNILIEMADTLQIPIYFVLGNHDYYRDHVMNVKMMLEKLTKENDYLYWLPAAGVQYLAEDIVLLGVDGWADGRYGDYANSRVSLCDSRLIDDLFQSKLLGKYALLEKMQYFADQDAHLLESGLMSCAVDPKVKKIIVITHVPPYPDLCLYQGKVSGDDFLPFFASKATGDVLTDFAKQHKNIDLLVLCGHTHASATGKPLDNLTIKVGVAEYLEPQIQEVITLS